jgi:dCMP deaminase
MNERMKKFYSDIAAQCSKMSRAVRLQVGCVIVKDDNILSFSWNGTPAGWDNNCENKVWNPGSGGWLSPEEMKDQYPYEEYIPEYGGMVRYTLKTKPEVLHAERNALDKLAKKGNIGGDGAYLFSTHAPCLECAKSIYGAGIKEVFYKEDYRSFDGIEFLKKCNIKVEKIE